MIKSSPTPLIYILGDNMKTIDYKFAELCDEIDYWQEKAEYWEQRCDDILKEYHSIMSNDIDNSNKLIGTMFEAILDPESNINK